MSDNKEYIINIRVSKDTYNKLKAKAKENSESLSSLVRKTLDDSYEIFTDFKNDIFYKKTVSADNIVHYQKVIVAKDTNCDRCQINIHKGAEMFLAETKTGTGKYFCGACFTNFYR